VSRRNRTRPPGVRPVATQAESRQARHHGQEVRARQAYSLGRAVPVPRDPTYVEITVTPALVAQAIVIIDRDLELVDWLTGWPKPRPARVARPPCHYAPHSSASG
jgi:hypothetical protein